MINQVPDVQMNSDSASLADAFFFAENFLNMEIQFSISVERGFASALISFQFPS